MSRDPRYQKLLNSKEWALVKRQVWQRAGGLCERCKREGFIRAGVDCHHKVPVESANPDDPQAMRRLAYSIDNIELLCVPCHIKTHQEMHSHRKDKVAENKARQRRRFMEANDPSWIPTSPDGDGSHD
jgi:5-methylcytosine-specific restriction endonuclease McrA